MKLTIGIKALNEAHNIDRVISAALVAAAPFDAEVIVADCGSTDDTVERASAYPIKILQLANTAERSCGTGAQLNFQQAQGDYFYMLDADMLIAPDFIAAAIAELEANPRLAGVGGQVTEMNRSGAGFVIRARQSARHWRPGIVDRLDCGGLYRTAAIRQVGYFADRNLHAFEEFELAARLATQNWHLARIDHPVVEHYGHTSNGYALLWRRLRSGYANATGEVLRAAHGRAHLPYVLNNFAHLRHATLVIVWWLAMIAAAAFGQPLALAVLVLIPMIWLVWRRRSIALGLYSLTAWNVAAVGLILGLCAPRVDPRQPLACRDLSPRAKVE